MTETAWFKWCLDNNLKIIPMMALVFIILFVILLMFPIETLLRCTKALKDVAIEGYEDLKRGIDFSVPYFKYMYHYKKD